MINKESFKKVVITGLILILISSLTIFIVLTIQYKNYEKIVNLTVSNLIDEIMEKYPETEVIAGTATAGIPHAAWIAEELNLPMIYVRSKPKDHGRGKQIEGVLAEGQKVVLIDDLLSTGGSVLKAVDAAKNEGADVLGVCGIFSYQLSKLDDNFKAYNLSYATLTNYTELIEVAEENNYIEEKQKEILHAWRKDPENWLK